MSLGVSSLISTRKGSEIYSWLASAFTKLDNHDAEHNDDGTHKTIHADQVLVNGVAVGAIDSGTATGGSATTLTDSAKAWGVNQLAGLTMIVRRAGAVIRTETVVSNTADTVTVASGTAMASGDDYELYGNGNPTLEQVLANGVGADAGIIGTVANPDVDIQLDNLKMLPFSSGSYTGAAAASDVTNYVGILRTMTLPVSPPAGVAAGQFALIGGIYYPIVSIVAGTSITVEYDSDDADPAAAADVIFCMWEFAGKYRGIKSYTSTSRILYYHPTKKKLRGVPAGFPAFTRMSDGSIGLQLEGVTRTNSVTLANHRLASTWNMVLGTGTPSQSGTGIDGKTNGATYLPDTDAAVSTKFSVTATLPAADTNTSGEKIWLSSTATHIPKIEFAFLNDIISSAYVDPTTGEKSADSSASVIVEPHGDGWLISDAGVNTNSRNSARIFVTSCARSTLNGSDDGTLTGGCYVDWWQVEYYGLTGLLAPSSLMIGGLTRNAQSVSLDPSNIVAPNEPFSLIMDYEMSGLSGGALYLFNCNGETTRNISFYASGGMKAYHGPTAHGLGGRPADRTKVRLEYKFDGANLEIWKDGVLYGGPWSDSAVTGSMTSLDVFTAGLFKIGGIRFYRPGLSSAESSVA